LLSYLQAATGIGRIYGPTAPSGLAKSPSMRWVVFSNAETWRLVEIFDANPPGGRKLLEFSFWRLSVLERTPGRGWAKVVLAS
jgi:hypothetical protein